MKILVLTFYYKPDLSAGSFRTTAFVDELKKLVDKDTQIEVITTLPNRYHSFEQKALASEIVGNVPSAGSNYQVIKAACWISPGLL